MVHNLSLEIVWTERMSGFVAIINTDGKPIDRLILQKLMDSLKLRGPDQQKVWIDGNIGLGHALFRTTDEAKFEKQPASLDNKIWISGCIRLDAREELVNKIGKKSEIQLSKTADSELALHAYYMWGEKFLEHLLGDFAFVIWDKTQKKLICARDRFGIRQLCYTQQGSTFIISNNIHCIRQHPAVTNKLSNAAIGDFLLFGDNKWGNRARTVFADIKLVEPAHCLVLEEDSSKIYRYWDIATDIPLLRYRKEQDYVEHFTEIFKIAVSDRLRTKDIVISLSGGMDSPSIGAIIREIEQERNQIFNLSAVTLHQDSIHLCDEQYFADQVSKRLEIPTHKIDGGKYSLLSPSIQTTHPMDDCQRAFYLDVDRYISKKARVVLDGNGGDEVLHFSSAKATLQDIKLITVLKYIYQLRRLYGTFPPLGTGINAFKGRLFGRHENVNAPLPYPSWINPDLEKELNLKQLWNEFWACHHSPTLSHRNSAMYKAVMTPDWGSDDFCTNCDFTPPERRSPFLDSRLVNFTMSLPALPWLFKKHILRKAMAGKLPTKVLERPKTPVGFLHDSLIRREDYDNLNNWKPTAELLQYVERSKIPPLKSGPGREIDSFINLRPLLLNTWLQEIN